MIIRMIIHMIIHDNPLGHWDYSTLDMVDGRNPAPVGNYWEL